MQKHIRYFIAYTSVEMKQSICDMQHILMGGDAKKLLQFICSMQLSSQLFSRKGLSDALTKIDSAFYRANIYCKEYNFI